MNASFFTRHPGMRDAINFVVFIGLVLLGTLFINTFIFRSFNVSGHSMDYTLHDGDRLIVSRLPATIAQLKNTEYTPSRGEIIVFKNPQYVVGSKDEYIVKRVIAFAGERVTVKDGVMTVYNNEHPEGFNPDTATKEFGTPRSPTSGSVDTVVATNTIFVSGDNRIGNNSNDSRSGLGQIPLYDIVGPVKLRVWPLTSLSII